MKSLNKRFIGLIALVFVSSALCAQVEATDSQGRKILLMPDGSYKFVDAKTTTPPAATAKNNNVIQSLDKVEKQKKEAEKKEKEAKEKLAKDQAKAEKELKEKLAKEQAKTEKEAKEKLAKEEAKKLKEAKELAEKQAKLAANQKTKNPVATKTPTPPQPKKTEPVKEPIKAKEATATAAPKKEITPTLPPTRNIFNDCQVASSFIDEFTGIKKTVLEEALFFSYTPAEYEKFMDGTDFMDVYATLTKEGENYSLTLNYVIDSPQGRAAFGALEEKPINLVFMSQESLLLEPIQVSGAKLTQDKKTIFQGIYMIDAKTAKQIKNNELDKILSSWQNAELEFDIFDLDFLARRLDCLNPKKA